MVDHARKSSVDEVMTARGSKVGSVPGVTVIAAPSELMVTRVPAVTDLDADPCEVIATGDWLLLDNSTVEVTQR